MTQGSGQDDSRYIRVGKSCWICALERNEFSWIQISAIRVICRGKRGNGGVVRTQQLCRWRGAGGGACGCDGSARCLEAISGGNDCHPHHSNHDDPEIPLLFRPRIDRRWQHWRQVVCRGRPCSFWKRFTPMAGGSREPRRWNIGPTRRRRRDVVLMAAITELSTRIPGGSSPWSTPAAVGWRRPADRRTPRPVRSLRARLARAAERGDAPRSSAVIACLPVAEQPRRRRLLSSLPRPLAALAGRLASDPIPGLGQRCAGGWLRAGAVRRVRRGHAVRPGRRSRRGPCHRETPPAGW